MIRLRMIGRAVSPEPPMVPSTHLSPLIASKALRIPPRPQLAA
jgi:hypothetical protein